MAPLSACSNGLWTSPGVWNGSSPRGKDRRMLIITKKNAPEEALDALKEYLIRHGFDIHQSTGANRTIIGVIGDTDALDARESEAMPGVSHVVRIRKDDTRRLPPGGRRFEESDGSTDGTGILPELLGVSIL